jgi:hypothetical protein
MRDAEEIQTSSSDRSSFAPVLQPGQRRVFHGSFVHALSNRKLEYLVDTLLAVDESGVIVFIQRDVRSEDIAGLLEQQQNGWEDVEVTALKRGEFIIPGWVAGSSLRRWSVVAGS